MPYKYIFTRKKSDQITNAPDEIIIETMTDSPKEALDQISNIFRPNLVLFNAHREFMKDVFFDSYECRRINIFTKAELYYKNLRSIFS